MSPPLSGMQFHYDNPELGESKPTHRVRALSATGGEMGSMLWNSTGIRNIGVASDQQRRGVATAMWHEGHRLAGENAKIPQPKHSDQRTDAGDGWAKSVGGKLPRRDKR